MKTISLNLSSLKFILLIMSFTLLSGCNKSDSNDNPSITFLEKYNGTKWEYKYPDKQKTDYLKFNNDTSAPFKEWWGHINSNCYEFIHQDPYYEYVDILENTADKLIVKFTEIGGDDIDTYTIRRSGDLLQIHITLADSDGIRAEQDYIYHKTTFNVDGITCVYE